MNKTVPTARTKWLALALAAATFAAYLPALNGGFVWDDNSWTRDLSEQFQNLAGLWAIWIHPTTLQQYYPLTGTSFWLDYQLWGFWTLPYHVENVLLHLLAVLLLWRLLLRLPLPGAGLAAALFALHPVMVESVAWITERKNVLSLVLYLSALLAYLRFAQSVGGLRPEVSTPQGGIRHPHPDPLPLRREREKSAPDLSRFTDHVSRITHHASRFYCLSLVLFLGALLAKTTVFSLPAVILLVAWWRRGRLRWRTDVLPTLPFFALSLGLSALTAWLERNHVGAQGPDFALTSAQRCIVAGHAFWFYLGKLFWPANLCFVYPRGQPDSAVWWQWLYPAAAVGLLLALWLVRQRLGRGPVTAAFFYVGTLFPLLGFLNTYAMRYSFVWDHWVYLPGLGPLVLAAALMESLHLQQWARMGAMNRTPHRPTGTLSPSGEWDGVRGPSSLPGFMERSRQQLTAILPLPSSLFYLLLLVLAVLTWRQAGQFADKQTLWRATLAGNPDCWMAHHNLGLELAKQGHVTEAIPHFQRTLQLKPDDAEIHYALGLALATQGKFAEAIPCYRRAIQLKPDYADALNYLGNALAAQGQWDAALQSYTQALQVSPDNPVFLNNSGIVLTRQGKLDEAIQRFERALQLKPQFADACNNLGLALAAQGKTAEAIPRFQQALALAVAQGNVTLAQSISAKLQSLPP